MYFINETYTETFEEKKSKFIAYLTPYENFNKMMEKIKKEHPKARHYVYAYRFLNEFDQVVENSSDDGEPKGTSGKPSLNVLAGKEFINCAVIIVRYFGGIKLGTGGLVRAYSDAVNLVINSSKPLKYEKLKTISFDVDYHLLSLIEYTIKNLDILISNKEFSENVRLTIQVSDEQYEKLKKQLPREVKI